MSETESKTLLAAFRVPIAKSVVAASVHEATRAATELGFPVAIKIDSPDITHKSDVGGVCLNLASAEAVRLAYQTMFDDIGRKCPQARLNGVSVEPMIVRPDGRELMIGVMHDSVFGPAITFGAGGTAVEVHRDRAVALPPLNAFLIADMIASTRVNKLLGAFRNMRPVDMQALEAVLMRVSEMVCELPWIEELDINPLIADDTGAIAVDARVVIRESAPMRTRYAHMAIHPYPTDLVTTWQTQDGTTITLRPIRPEDAQMEQELIKGLSHDSSHSRFMNTVRELTPAMLVRFTQIDYDREMAFVAVHEQGGREVELAVGRYVSNPDGQTCEFAVVVADSWQGKGLGRRVLMMVIDAARTRGLKAIVGHVLATNQRMLGLCEKLAFEISVNPEDAMLRRATLVLARGESAAK